MLSLTLLLLLSHLFSNLFLYTVVKNIMGVNGAITSSECAPSLEIKDEFCLMARWKKKAGGTLRRNAKKKKKHPCPWITQGLLHAALCKQRTHFPPWYDSVAEWRPPLSDFPPSSGPPPFSYLTPSSHTGTQWKGIPHYLSVCLTKHTACHISSLLVISMPPQFGHK